LKPIQHESALTRLGGNKPVMVIPVVAVPNMALGLQTRGYRAI
jgi:hypothetical protein